MTLDYNYVWLIWSVAFLCPWVVLYVATWFVLPPRLKGAMGSDSL